MGSILSELRRRNVFRVAAAYLVVGWIVLQVVSVVGDAAHMPDWTDSFALVVLLTAFPVVLFIAWAFELTPDGLKRTVDVAPEDSITHKTGRLFDYVIVTALVLVAGLIGWQLLATETRTPDISQVAAASGAPDAVVMQPAAVAAASDASPVAAVEPDAKSIAVLPFIALSNDEEDGFFADGLTEEILNSLAYLPDLLVTSRTSAFQFRGDDLPSVPEIAAQLGVAHILEGSVRRSNDQVRVTAQLIRASDDAHLWSQTYDRSLDNVFAIQEDIAENVARVLEVVLDDTARERMAHSGARNVEAFIAYQRGVEIWMDLHSADEEEQLHRANVYFEEATRLDPDFSEAFLLWSDAYAHEMVTLASSAEIDAEAFEAARNEHARLLEHAEAASRDPVRRAIARGNRMLFSDDWSGARQVLDQAMSTESCAAGNYINTLAEFLSPNQELLDYARNQTRCDPLNPTSWGVLSGAAFRLGLIEEALAAERRRAALADPSADASGFMVIEGMIMAGDYDATIDMLDTLNISGNDRIFLEFRAAARAGDRETALRRQAQMLALPNFPDTARVIMHALVGERDQANAAMARVDARPIPAMLVRGILNLCNCGAPFDLEAAPNFAARIEEAGFPWPPEPDYGFALMQE